LINDACRVSGNIQTTAGTITIIHSFIDAVGGNVWTGTVEDPDGFDAIFNGVKGEEEREPI
jgi:hypothetical protein